jgi:Zn-dependent protease
MTPQAVACPNCATELAPGLLNCPSCSRLVHAERLTELAATAGAAERAQAWSVALAAWREVAPLLPAGTRQRAVAERKIAELSPRAGTAASADPRPWWKRLTALGPVGIAAALLGKAKFLLLGFTKMGTLLTFVAGFSIYWTIWGWQFALCFLLAIYIHEMGHVAALRRYGIPATAPMFIPGFGALVRLRQSPVSAVEDARVGLAGPLWGLMASVGALAIYGATRNPLWLAVSRAGAWLNLFNLLPVWQLDGSRGIRSLDRAQVWMLALLTVGIWAMVSDGMLLLIAALLVVRAMRKPEDSDGDWPGFLQFAGLIVALGMLCLIPLPGR